MNSNLSTLVKMQEIDDQIGIHEVEKKKLPEELDSLHEMVKSTKEAYEAAHNALLENQKTQKAKELEIKANKETMAKYENQLLAIKTNKEYKALHSEINHLKEGNKKIDDELIQLMEAEAALKTGVADAQSDVKKAEKELNDNEDKLNKKIEVVNQEIEKLKQSRNEIAKSLPRQLIKRYVLLIKNKNRKAVVFANNDACEGCGFKVRPQMAIEVSKGNKIISCENCGRILVKDTKA